jgi:4-amino-4-deoxy-L-arabinose transferase-like glycosyltransferase
MVPRLIHTYRVEIIIALITLGINAACFFLFVHINNGDVLSTVRVDDGFYELAENVLAGNGFSWSTEAPYQPNSMRTPGYVFVLAGLIAVFGVTGAAVVQLLLATAIPLLGMQIARLITNSRKISIITGVILALNPMLAQLSFQFYTETIFLLVFLSWLLVTLYYFKRLTITLLILSALLFGGAVLIKASVQYLPLILIPCLAWAHGWKHWRRSLVHISLFLLIVGTVVSPWIVRNLETFDAIGFSTQSTFVLYTNFAPAVITIAENHDFITFRNSFLTPEEFRGDAITFANQDDYKAKAIDIILEHPTATAHIMAKSVFTFFTSDGFYSLLTKVKQDPSDYFIFLVVTRLLWIGVTCAALVGAGIYLWTRFTPQTLFIITLVAYLALVSTVAAFGTNPRYRLPVDPIIISMAMVGAGALWTLFTKKFPRAHTFLNTLKKGG